MRTLTKKLAGLGLALALTASGGVNAAASVYSFYDYEGFDKVFHYSPGAPTDATFITQDVLVYGNEEPNAYAKCTQYNFIGNRPTLTVVSTSKKFPTTSTSFAGESGGRAMKYTDVIPTRNSRVKFTGTVDNYTSFTIAASVKG